MDQDRSAQEVDDRAFEALLDWLKHEHGTDFTGYKRTGLMRRVRKRMAHAGIGDLESYRDYLVGHAGEYEHLLDAVLINVTGFFRDPEAWKGLAVEVLPALGAGRSGPVRAWCAGCSTGEEPYTLVMLLAEQMGWDEVRSRVKIYATDVDEWALQQARTGGYSERAVESLPPHLLERYFDPVAGGFVFKAALRRCVVFGRNDLARDPPIPRLKLLICRNTLMYFKTAVQHRILRRFHFSLDEDGVLFLGRAEMALSGGNLFTPIDLRSRIFARVPGRVMPEGSPTSTRRDPQRSRDGGERGLGSVAAAPPVAQVVAGTRDKGIPPPDALQAAGEELDTTREELRSAVEELAAANDELHATNRELRSINNELRRRTEQLSRMSSYLSTILSSFQVAVVLDHGLRVRLWTERAQALWGLHADVVEGKPFFSLDLDVPVECLRGLVRRCLQGYDVAPVVLGGGMPHGRKLRYRVRCARLAGTGSGTRGVILMMEEMPVTETIP
jgi:chemotaxis methyl-accepting protein methylase